MTLESNRLISHRGSWQVGAYGIGLLIGSWSSAALSTERADQGLSGMWWIENYQSKLLPEGGTDVPFTVAGRERYEKNVAQLASGALADPGTSICLPQGLPRTMFAVYPLQIIEHGKYVTFVHEVNHTFWSLTLDGKHSAPDDVDPAFMGESVGHWSHGALIVDTIGFKARSFLDDTGLPHSEKLHVTLRMQRINRQHLEVLATIDDPDVFTTPWSARRVYELRRDVLLTDYVCGQPHRTLTGTRASGVPLTWVAK